MSAETGLGGWIDGSAGGVNAVAWLVALALVVAAGTFFLAPGLAAYPLGAVAIVVAYGWLADEATTARTLALAATVATVSVLGLITIYLVAKSLPAFRIMGLDVLTKTDGTLWASSVPVYSLVPMIWGTLLATSIAAAIAAPLGIAGAVFISEMAPTGRGASSSPRSRCSRGSPRSSMGSSDSHSSISSWPMNSGSRPAAVCSSSAASSARWRFLPWSRSPRTRSRAFPVG
jgi:phosphate transport system permease protein